MLLAHDAPEVTMRLQRLAPGTHRVVNELRDCLYGVDARVDERAREVCFTFSSARTQVEARARLVAVLRTHPGWSPYLRF